MSAIVAHQSVTLIPLVQRQAHVEVPEVSIVHESSHKKCISKYKYGDYIKIAN